MENGREGWPLKAKKVAVFLADPTCSSRQIRYSLYCENASLNRSLLLPTVTDVLFLLLCLLDEDAAVC